MLHAGYSKIGFRMIDLYSIRKWNGLGNHYIVFKLSRSVKTSELNWCPVMHSTNLENLMWEYPNAYDNTNLPPVTWNFIPYEGFAQETESES